ncbi:MAG: hypothetical protein C4576_00210 [Desulfobacteraceae bacterium]|nr:MAG: hypothetical protein C4576_00210 [Desulfobacteraceae bacterium]
MSQKPRILIVIPRGEAVRNFLYSDTLPLLSQNAEVSLLSVTTDEKFTRTFSPYAVQVFPLKQHREKRFVLLLRDVVIHAHYRWMWSAKAKNKWEMLSAQAATLPHKAALLGWMGLVRALANRAALQMLTDLDRRLSWQMRPTHEFERLLANVKPSLVFNGSHVHGEFGDLPMRVAKAMGFRTAAFIFSWDNLSTRSRIMVPYDHYLMWNQDMRDHLLRLYPEIHPSQVHITGTPQFDFHHNSEYWLSREELCRRLGIDPNRPFVLYTTGMSGDFPEEHRTVRYVADILEKIGNPRPQMVVRTYVKGTTAEMWALAKENLPDVVFPKILWEEKWFTPMIEDQAIYTSLLRETSLGINVASTVSLELMMHGKPVINLAFDPPGSRLPHWQRYRRHIEFDHYRPVAQSGGVMVAETPEDIKDFMSLGLRSPERFHSAQHDFLKKMFNGSLDGRCGERVARKLLALAADN